MNSTLINDQQTQDERLRDLILEIDELPSIPETLIEILRVLDDPDSGPADLGAVIRLDAPLMARILRLANSPYYSRRGDITDINRCVTVLGYRTVRQVAICVSVATSVISALEKSSGHMDYRELWRHSVVTGAISKHLAQIAGYPDPEEAFTAGLLHDMGKFVLELHAPDLYHRVIADRRTSSIPLVEAEESAFGYNHAMIGQAFGQAWRFPRILTRCFGEHHTLVLGGQAVDKTDHAVALVALADYLANTLEPSRSDLGFDPRFCNVADLHQVAGLPVDAVENDLERIRESVTLASAYLDLS